jgi:hypothetical protein
VFPAASTASANRPKVCSLADTSRACSGGSRAGLSDGLVREALSRWKRSSTCSAFCRRSAGRDGDCAVSATLPLPSSRQIGQVRDSFHQRSIHPLQKACLQDRILRPPLAPTWSRQIVQESDAAGTAWRDCPGRCSVGFDCCCRVRWMVCWSPDGRRGL